MFTQTPFISTVEQTMSLVVPGCALTIEIFSSNKQFMRDDFPALGGPETTTFTPSLIFFENSAFSIATNKFSFILSSFILKEEIVFVGSSSSEKSIL